METKEKPVLYYIHATDTNQLECIKAIEAKGAQNTYDIDSNCKLPCIFYIDDENIIDVVFSDSDMGRLIISYGTELHIPEKRQALTYEELTHTVGYFLCENSLVRGGHKYKADFATEQIAKSAQAAAMISQIREQGKDIYGEIVMKDRNCYILQDTPTNGDIEPLSCSFEFANYGGLLRFLTKRQAKLFLENNRELVEEYLKTF